MRLAYISNYNAKDIKQFSGLGYHIAESLVQQKLELTYIFPLIEKYSLLYKGKTYFYRKLLKKNYLRDREPTILKSYAKQVTRKLSSLKVDIIFSPGSIPIAYLESHHPIVFWSDATFANIVNFYPTYCNLCRETLENGHAMEKAALDRCSMAIYASIWAAQSAIKNYQIPAQKVKVVPFGGNIPTELTSRDIESLVKQRLHNQCHLLFIGRDWERKGGDIAVEVARELNKMGVRTQLTVLGCDEQQAKKFPNFVKYAGYADKSTHEGMEKITQLLAIAHFLILPSRAEAFGHVLCEANSFGVPCLVSNVGGLPTVIKDDVNGKIFPVDAKVSEYCEYISDLFYKPSEYQRIALSAFWEYKTRLNWFAAGKQVNKLLHEI
ncbi:MAG: glycosyltransferase family 4 protein [Cyanobacteria bacterium P01_A01_bin.45]